MLADGDGMLVVANRRMEEMFGYQQDDLAGHPVESLIPALHAAHHSHRADYAQAPEATSSYWPGSPSRRRSPSRWSTCPPCRASSGPRPPSLAPHATTPGEPVPRSPPHGQRNGAQISISSET